MMPSFVGASLPGVPPVHYTQDALLEDLSRQMLISASRGRQSRGPHAAYSGNAMRVVKPSSANNSPRNNLMQPRRRTMLNDAAYAQKTLQVLEQPCLPTPGPDAYANSYYEPVKKAARPVSWHPSTQVPFSYQQPLQQQHYPVSTQQSHQFPFPNCYDYDVYAPMQMPPTPAAYSAYGSPVSTLSPPAVPACTAYDMPQQQQQQYASPNWDMSAAPVVPPRAHVPTPSCAAAAASYTPAPVPDYAALSHSPASWVEMSSAYNHCLSAPPTPEEPTNFAYTGPVVVKQQLASFSAPTRVQMEDEDGSEVLFGLGLYDPPEKTYGSLLGASFEPTGKGLKLEDAWEPPAEEEEDDEEDDGDDAESEEE